jgi:tetratricopeptide (TPR) repeat protein
VELALMQKVFSTTLTGNNEAGIARVLSAAAPLVKKCILIDTGITDATIKAAKDAVGAKLIVREFPWRNDFAAARNFALAEAEQLGADWALTVDSDELLLPRPDFSLQRALSDDDCKVLYAKNAPGFYEKERAIKLRHGIHWIGLTHEYLTGFEPHEARLTLNLVFDEPVKDMATLKRKNERDIPLLKQMLWREPKNPRWPFYLGTTHANMGEHEIAISYFNQAMRIGDWEGDGARAADAARFVYARLGKFDEAIALYENRLRSDPGAYYLHTFVQDLKDKRARWLEKQAKTATN